MHNLKFTQKIEFSALLRGVTVQRTNLTFYAFAGFLRQSENSDTFDEAKDTYIDMTSLVLFVKKQTGCWR